MITQRDIFPYIITENNATSKDKGLSEFVRLCFGKALNKSEQCSNWERRPLRDAQKLYAGIKTNLSFGVDFFCLFKQLMRIVYLIFIISFEIVFNHPIIFNHFAEKYRKKLIHQTKRMISCQPYKKKQIFRH
jgi:hypothetical protein